MKKLSYFSGSVNLNSDKNIYNNNNNNNNNNNDKNYNNLTHQISSSTSPSPKPSASVPTPIQSSENLIFEENDDPQQNHRHPTISDPNQRKHIYYNTTKNSETTDSYNFKKIEENQIGEENKNTVLVKSELKKSQRDQSDNINCPYSLLCVEDILSAFQGLVDAVVVCNNSSIVLGINEAASALFGYRSRELLGEKVIRLVDAASLPQDDYHFSLNVIGILQNLAAEIDLSRGESSQLLGVRKDGKRFPLAIQVREVKSSKNKSEALFILQIHDASVTLNRKKTDRSDSSYSASRYKTEFKELGKLGSGGFGKVYRAINRLDGAEYAVKKVKLRHTVQDIRDILEQTADAETPANKKSGALKVLREVKTMARIANHPNVVRYFNCWIEANSASKSNSHTTMSTPSARTPLDSSVFNQHSQFREESKDQKSLEPNHLNKYQLNSDYNTEAQPNGKAPDLNNINHSDSINGSEASEKIDNEELDSAIINGWPSMTDPFRAADEELARSPHQDFIESGGHHNLVCFEKEAIINNNTNNPNHNREQQKQSINKIYSQQRREKIDDDKQDSDDNDNNNDDDNDDYADGDISTESSSVPSILYVGSLDEPDYSFSGPGSWSNQVFFSHRSPPPVRPGSLTTSTSASLAVSNQVNRRDSSPEHRTPTPSSLPRSPMFFMLDGDEDNEEEQRESELISNQGHGLYPRSEGNNTDQEHLGSLSNRSEYHSDGSTDNNLTPGNNQNKYNNYSEEDDDAEEEEEEDDQEELRKEEKNEPIFEMELPSALTYNYTNQLDEVFQFEEVEEPQKPFKFSVTDSSWNTSNNSNSDYYDDNNNDNDNDNEEEEGEEEDIETTESSNNTVGVNRSQSSSFSNPTENSQDTDTKSSRTVVVNNSTNNNYNIDSNEDDGDDNDDDYDNSDENRNKSTLSKSRPKPEPIYIPENHQQRLKKKRVRNAEKQIGKQQRDYNDYEDEEYLAEAEETPNDRIHHNQNQQRKQQRKQQQPNRYQHRSHSSKDHAILYIQMEFCESDTLKEWLHREDRVVTYEENMPIFIQIVRGLKHIHSKGFIHRDIKPPNIFVNSNNVKIGDFGLAKNFVAAPLVPVDGGHTPMAKTGSGREDGECETPHSALLSRHVHRRGSSISLTADIGTHLYASPEQLEGGLYNAKVDIFSLGIVLFEMFSKFSTGMERVQVLSAFKDTQVIPPEMKERFPEATELMVWLTKPDPKQRPTAEQILASDFVRHHTEPDSCELDTPTVITSARKDKPCKGCVSKEETIAKLLKENRDYSCQIEEQQETISRLRLQLLEFQKYIA